MLTVITAGALMFLSILFIVLAIKKHKSTGKAPVALIALALIFIVTLAIVPFSIHVVNTGEVAVVKEFGEAKEIKTAGMHFDLWFIAQYDYYDAKVQNVELKTSAYSSDAQTMNISMTLQFHISTEHAIDIARQYGNLDALQSRIEAIAIEKTKSVLSSYKAMDIISDRASMSPRVEEAIKKAITDEYFVTVSTVVLTNIDFSEAFEKAVEEKMITMARIVTFGELMLRLQPYNYERFVQASNVEFTFGGGEANVSVSLANYGFDAVLAQGVDSHLADGVSGQLGHELSVHAVVGQGDSNIGLAAAEGSLEGGSLNERKRNG